MNCPKTVLSLSRRFNGVILTYRFVKHLSELDDIKPSQTSLRSILVICDLKLPTDGVIQGINNWFSITSKERKEYVCFAGKFSELAHDIYDEIDAYLDRFAMTAWHDDESIEDIAFFYANTIPICNDGYHDRVVFMEEESTYQNALINELKEYKIDEYKAAE